MKWTGQVLSISAIGLILGSAIYLAETRPFTDTAQGDLRCEDARAIVVRVAGQDYAVTERRLTDILRFKRFGARPISTSTLTA
jgi:hypothetical protein